jgi:hypothetical protein
MVDVDETFHTENKTVFEQRSLCRKRTVHHVEETNSDLPIQMTQFGCFSMALDGSTDAYDTVQLRTFIRGVDEEFEVSHQITCHGNNERHRNW